MKRDTFLKNGLTGLTIIPNILEILFESAQSHVQNVKGYPRLMQGPMVGTVTQNEIVLWGRASGPFKCYAEYDTTPYLLHPKQTKSLASSKANNYTIKLVLSSLKPNTTYYYRIKVDDTDDHYLKDSYPFSVSTAPGKDWEGTFKIAYGSCARVQMDSNQPIWEAVERRQPDLFFWLGDNIYSDTPDPDLMEEIYQRQRNVESWQPISCKIPQLAIWDDHDYGFNNQDKFNPMKEESLALFKRYWVNPSYGLLGTPGVFFKYSYGGVDFFFLDGMFYRDPEIKNNQAGKTMLGTVQFKWLKNKLQMSTAHFKILVMGQMWGNDFKHERDSFFSFIHKNEISGIVILSGNLHMGKIDVYPRFNNIGYDIYNLVSSPLAQPTGNGWVDSMTHIHRRIKRISHLPNPDNRISPLYFGSINFGLLSFDLEKTDPSLTFELIGVNGHRAWKPLVLHASDLKNGMTTWEEKLSQKALEY